MITAEGNVCLIDFNVSLDEESKTELSGISQYYASPEQYEKAMSILYQTRTTAIIDQRTDIYSLGATFYHLITGTLPTVTVANTPLARMAIPYYSQDFLQIIDKMMDPDVRTRYHKVSDIVSALDRAYNKNKATTKLTMGLVASSVAWIVAVSVGISLCAYGNKLMSIEDYNADYSEFEECYDTGDYENAIDLGIGILNNTEYSKLFDDNKEIKCSVLQGVGECYFNEEQYEEACKYYEQAVKLCEDTESRGELVRDYAVSLARLDKVSDAEALLENAKADGLGDEDLSLVRGEIHWIRGEYEKAAEIARELKDSKDDEIASHALVLLAGALESMEDYEGQLDCLEALCDREPTILNLRRLGDAYIKYGEKQKDYGITKKENCYKNAKECYEQIVDNKYATKNDKMNLSVVYMALGEYDDAVALLKEVYKEDPKDYKVCMYLAFTYDMKKDFVNAKEYCQKAVKLYENTPKNNRESATSDNIVSLYELENKLR